eukprot:TRINITY_DN5038_c0_g2_i5.p1 TRINITY_DN5038_c0_g2~~TRINITY_DN5038_c0_g2_i5.p1  ORF type:complete len:121 (-),score=36.12 TRINITY_DN5038_c0_g2_i5:36-371(-)
MIRRPPRSTPLYSSAASDVYKRQAKGNVVMFGNAVTQILNPAEAKRKEEEKKKSWFDKAWRGRWFSGRLGEDKNKVGRVELIDTMPIPGEFENPTPEGKVKENKQKTGSQY